MRPKSLRNAYWIATIIIALFMLMDGFGGITMQEAGQESLKHLGYPLYALYIFGVAKILGAVAILQNKYKVIKEWAYAGFTFNFIGAAASTAFVGDGIDKVIFPIIALFILAIPYTLWKRYSAYGDAQPVRASA